MSKMLCVPCAKKYQIDLDDVFRIEKCSVCGLTTEVGIEFVPLVAPPPAAPDTFAEDAMQTIEIDLSTLHGAFVRVMMNEKAKRALGAMAVDLVDYLAGEKSPHAFTSQLNMLLQALSLSQR